VKHVSLGNFSANENSRLHRYLTDTVHVDIFWYIGSRLGAGPSDLPPLDEPIIGSSIVPWRYHFKTGKCRQHSK
jgi:alpha-N-acetylglucosaminidase